jgi:hypothetical protein
MKKPYNWIVRPRTNPPLFSSEYQKCYELYKSKGFSMWLGELKFFTKRRAVDFAKRAEVSTGIKWQVTSKYKLEPFGSLEGVLYKLNRRNSNLLFPRVGMPSLDNSFTPTGVHVDSEYPEKPRYSIEWSNVATTHHWKADLEPPSVDYELIEKRLKEAMEKARDREIASALFGQQRHK